MMLLLMMLTATTAWAATVQFPIYSGDEGTPGKPYQIKTIDDLNKLAADVNSGTNYEGKYFRLENDLDFYEATNTALRPTTAWDDATSQENNYTAIGLYSGTTANCRYFCGHFDGNGMTIRGIRIYSTETTKGFGLFGLIGSGAEVKNVVLDEARIAGGGYSAGIVGWNEGGTIDGCQATAKVAVVGTRPDANTRFLGGIVGRNGINGSSTPDGSTVKNCTSSVTISYIGSEKSRYCGGIAGFNKGTMTDNFVIGANICEASSNDYGAIMGHTNSTGTTVQRNYYRDCTVAGVANAIDKGCENSNITAYDGAMPVFTLTMGTGITTTTDATVTYSGTSYYVFGKAITLSGGLDNVGSFAPGYTAGYATTSGSVSGNATDGFILTMGYGDATVSASNRYPIDWAMESTGDDADHAYMIYNPEQLDLLAQRVNNGEDYAGKFFKLGANIAYAHKAANEEGADTENNYTAIGNYISSSHPFNGTFLGQNHVVSGIRIYSGSNSASSRQGLFGYVGKTGVVSNVIVTDARIVGYGQLGVIAGSVFYNSSLSHNYYYNCTVRTATTGIGCNGADITDNDGAVSIHTLTLADGITAEPTPVFTISGTPYYSPGTTVTLSYNGTSPTGCIHDYIVTKDGTDPAETVEVAESNGVYSFTMPASNVTVTSNTIQCYTLMLADGITATPTPTITVGSTPYYRPGTTVALSYTGELSTGYGPVYTMTKDGTSVVVTTPGTFSMPASNVTISVTVTDLWGVSANPAADGSADHPYVITNAAGLDLLAQRMNGGTGYGGTYFKLMNDIAYPYATAWNAADSQENNFTRIGTGPVPFYGTFDGQGHTISGIRIYSSDDRQGLFGYVNRGCVRNVTLADARNAGQHLVGGIAGHNRGTIENCHVTANVLIGSTGDNPSRHGGIAGYNEGTVDGCTSSATLSQASECGGIVGCNRSEQNVVKNCLAVGVTIYGNNNVGAIVGNEVGTLSHNYYSGCTVYNISTEQSYTSCIGCNRADIEDNDGAVPGTLHTLTLASDITATGIMVNQGGTISVVDGTTVTLSYNGTLPTGCIHEGYIVTKDGTNPAETVEVAESNGVYSFTMPASNVTVSAVFEAIPWSGTGTSTDPYIIEYPSQLDLLAHRVNGTHGETANNYYQKFFRLGADITYAHTTAWNDASSTENNYTAIGERPNFSTEHPFSGTFDGDGHTVSGIRIYKGGSGWGNYFQGLFGFLAGATVKNVTVADARITGDINVGGIAGDANDNMDIQTDINSTIENCHVLSDVTIHAVVSTDSHGGIAGNNRGTVSNCTSAATLTVKDGVTGCTAFGGIVGYQLGGVISNNLAVGVTMPAGTSAGAICGCKQGGTFEYNYYSNCAVGTATSNIGCYGADIETDPNDATNHPDGAVFAPATRYGAITMIEKGTKKHAIIDGNYSGTDGINIAEDFAVDDVTFNRTFPADKYCTIVLPFEINTSYLTGVDYVLSFAGMTYDENGMLTYMAQIVWEKSLEHVDLQSYTPYMVLTNRSRLSINNTTPVTIERTRDAFTEKDDWEFRGVTAYTIWDATHNNALLGRVYGFAATSGKATDGVTDVNVGDFVRAEAGAYAYPLRAYLLKKETSSAAPRRAVALDDLPDRIPVRIVDSADGSTTSLNEELRMKSEEFLSGESVARNAAATGWFTLSGTRLNGKPSAKGLYIHNGKKVVIN